MDIQGLAQIEEKMIWFRFIVIIGLGIYKVWIVLILCHNKWCLE